MALALAVQGGCESGQDSFPVGEAAACVEVDLSKFDQSCTRDSDCRFVVGGAVGNCTEGGCYYGAINSSAVPSYRKALGSVTNPQCGDLELGEPRCREHICRADSEAGAEDGAVDSRRE